MKTVPQSIVINGPFLMGFFISFLGTLPFGYLNIMGLQMLMEQGIFAFLLYVFGIVIIEFFVLWAVSKLSKWLVQQKKLLLFIDLFTILFFLSIAYYFYSILLKEEHFSLARLPLAKYPLVLGLLLSSLNFIQWPYWSGVYLYLFRINKLATAKTNAAFILGALIGTYAGIVMFAFIGEFMIADRMNVLNQYLNIFFVILFLLFGLIQLTLFSIKQFKLRHT